MGRVANRRQTRLCWLLCGCLIVMSVMGYAGEVCAGPVNPMRAPQAAQPAQRQGRSVATASFPAVVFDAYLRFFQRVISPVDGARSNMYPTGSDYSRRAFKKHGALLGLVLTTERLMHEGNEGLIAPRIRKYDLWRIYDPVEANDWWWQEPRWVYKPRSGGK